MIIMKMYIQLLNIWSIPWFLLILFCVCACVQQKSMIGLFRCCDSLDTGIFKKPFFIMHFMRGQEFFSPSHPDQLALFCFIWPNLLHRKYFVEMCSDMMQNTLIVPKSLSFVDRCTPVNFSECAYKLDS